MVITTEMIISVDHFNNDTKFNYTRLALVEILGC